MAGKYLYYVAIPVVFAALYACFGGLQAIASGKENLGWLSLISAEVFIILLPVAAVLLMRATPLRWPVDPFAAAEIPLFVFALLCSLSKARMKGNSFYYKHIEKN